MDDIPQPDSREQRNAFRTLIETKETRKLRARGEQYRSLWFGLGMFGVVGWSIALPTVLGVAMGLWIDRRWPSRLSWTLMLLCIGVVLGCLNAWYWIKQESQQERGEGLHGGH